MNNLLLRCYSSHMKSECFFLNENDNIFPLHKMFHDCPLNDNCVTLMSSAPVTV